MATGDRLAHRSRITMRARINPHALFVAFSPIFATYLNIRGRKCDIIKRLLRALLSVVTLVTRSPRVTCGTQVSTHDRANGRPGAGATAGEPADSSCRLCALKNREENGNRWSFLLALIAFFLRQTPIL